MKILVAEDDVSLSLLLHTYLEKWGGYEIISATDGDEAWAALQEPDSPLLVIMDWMMPGLDGLTICRRLREQDRQISRYIILMTGKSTQQDIIQGLEAGADDYVTKPVDYGELRARINVGSRMLALQHELKDREKFKGVVEMAGAVCHELNQPLQGLLGLSEILLMDLDPINPSYEIVKQIIKEVERIGILTHRFMTINKYRTKNYMGGISTIVDIEKSSSSGD